VRVGDTMHTIGRKVAETVFVDLADRCPAGSREGTSTRPAKEN
jgi:hypothetical protein